MENAVIAIVTIVIILTGTLTLFLSAFPSIDTLSDSWKQMTQQAVELRRTEITSDDYTVSGDGEQVEIMVNNNGEVPLSNFTSWDVIVQYYTDNSSCSVKWLSYTSSALPEDNEWTVNGIYFNGSAETIEPNILNPGEEMKVLMQLNPSVGDNTTNRATISTPNGIATQIIFQR